MSFIEMEGHFSEQVFVQRKVVSNIEYNTKVDIPIGGCVFVRTQTNQIVELKKSQGYILNKKEFKWSPFKKRQLDDSCYEIYFFSKSSFSGQWGGTVNCKNKNMEPIQSVPIQVQLNFMYRIVDQNIFIEKNIPNGGDANFSEKFFANKIRDEGKNAQIESICAKAINKYGLDMIDSKKDYLAEELESMLNGFYRQEKGVEVDILMIKVNEHEVYKNIREEKEIKEFMEAI